MDGRCKRCNDYANDTQRWRIKYQLIKDELLVPFLRAIGHLPLSMSAHICHHLRTDESATSSVTLQLPEYGMLNA
jgi:hypothetical protein